MLTILSVLNDLSHISLTYEKRENNKGIPIQILNKTRVSNKNQITHHH